MLREIRDVCVVGGGPAGLAAAIALKQTGYGVTVVDHAVPPIDKTCGEGLMPDCIAALEELGVSIPAGAGVPFRGIQFIGGESSVTANFPSGTGVGLRRTALHDLLASRASELGVECVWGAKRIDVNGSDVTADGARVPCQFIVGADGQNSSLRRRAGLDSGPKARLRYAFRRHYRLAPWSQYMQLYWGKNCQLYITAVAPDEVCVVSMARDAQVRLDTALGQFPGLRQRLSAAPIASREKGGLSVTRQLERIWTDNFALVGDASGSVDAITGEGMCLAFKHALSLARALSSGALEEYGRQHRAVSQRPRFMGSLMLTLDSHSEFQRRALASLERHPNVFAALMRAHVGEQPLTRVLSWRLLPLCGSFLAA